MRLLIGLVGALLLMPVVESTAAAEPVGMSRHAQGRSHHARKRRHHKKRRHHAKRKKHRRGKHHRKHRVSREL